MTVEEAIKLIPGGLPGVDLKTLRTLTTDHLRRAERGWKFGLCTWCLKPIPSFPQKYFWCSKICTDRLQSYQIDREQIWHRDKGVCSQCKTDTEKLGKQLTDLGSYTEELLEETPLTLGRYQQVHKRKAEIDQETLEQASNYLKGITEEADVKAIVIADWAKSNKVEWMLDRYGKHLWEMDHIIPVAEGGGLLGINNLTTLCMKCHWKKSKSEKKFRKKRAI